MSKKIMELLEEIEKKCVDLEDEFIHITQEYGYEAPEHEADIRILLKEIKEMI